MTDAEWQMALSDGEGITAVQSEMIDEADAWQRAQRLPDQIFLSHRGRHYPEVSALAERPRTGAFPGVPARAVRVVHPAELALDGELLSAGRRWMLVALLDDLLQECTELWVYDSPDYATSWWTLAELVMAANLHRDGLPAPLPTARYDPASATVTPQAGLRPRLTEDIRRDLARYLIHSRPTGMSPELAPQYRLERLITCLGADRAYLRLLRGALQTDTMRQWTNQAAPAGTGVDVAELLRDGLTDLAEHRRRVLHPSRHPRFWNELLLDVEHRYPIDATALVNGPQHMISISPEPLPPPRRTAPLSCAPATGPSTALRRCHPDDCGSSAEQAADSAAASASSPDS